MAREAWRTLDPSRACTDTEIVEASVALLRSAFLDLRQSGLQTVRDAWGELLLVALRLRDICAACRGRHPADREWNDVFLLEWSAQIDIDRLVTRLGTVGRGIAGRLG